MALKSWHLNCTWNMFTCFYLHRENNFQATGIYEILFLKKRSSTTPTKIHFENGAHITVASEFSRGALEKIAAYFVGNIGTFKSRGGRKLEISPI